MHVPKIVDELEAKIITTRKLSRFQNQIVGKGSVRGLKSATYLLHISKPTIIMSRCSSLRPCENVSQFGL